MAVGEVRAIDSRDARVRAKALRRLRSACGRVDEADRLLALSIAFEALLDDEKNELTFRYALRAALFLRRN
ncbi:MULTISPECIES: hypothetical protein [unclassified Brevundimonas]|jgi:hypothetical protein|uniref:hypothetical protein n=1 Tax=unclassified Brevundimonas TaxID=2622653 RepID=UPI0025C38EB0|nr:MULTISPECIES: hypothetical protein [unclassified Brevundimonas]